MGKAFDRSEYHIVAEGEATGHAHAVPFVDALFDMESRILDVQKNTKMVHQEHDAIPLTPKKYCTGIVRELSETEEARRVMD